MTKNDGSIGRRRDDEGMNPLRGQSRRAAMALAATMLTLQLGFGGAAAAQTETSQTETDQPAISQPATSQPATGQVVQDEPGLAVAPSGDPSASIVAPAAPPSALPSSAAASAAPPAALPA